MTSEEFDKATPQERNTAIALVLGWRWVKFTMYAGSPGPHYVIHRPEELVLYLPSRILDKLPKGATFYNPYTLPDWQGDDGLAFKELWPEILKAHETSESALLKLQDGKPIIVNEPWNLWIADTWAHAITKCFLALKADTARTLEPVTRPFEKVSD